MSSQTTLLTSHKGVDLHAATAVRVMRERLEGGERLQGLHRCEMHTYRDAPAGVSLERLLDTGRYFNPNKHHYGHFELADAEVWPEQGGALAAAWPGAVVGTDLTALAQDAAGLYRQLLGGELPAGCTAVDVAAWARDQEGPVVSGVLWRLVVSGPAAEAGALGEQLAVARTRKRGMLVNPHMEAWLTVVR
jgi:hypothetical protein